MLKFPVDAPIRKVITALKQLGFNIIREGNHIAMLPKIWGHHPSYLIDMKF